MHQGVVESRGAVECTYCGDVFDCLDALVTGTELGAQLVESSADPDGPLLAREGLPLAKPYHAQQVAQHGTLQPRTLPSLNPDFNSQTRSPGRLGLLLAELKGITGLAARNLVRNRRRSAFAFLAISFGVVSVLLAGGFIEWILWASREAAIRSQLGHVQVMRSGYLERGQAAPFDYLLPGELGPLKRLESASHVTALSPRLIFSGLVGNGDTTISFLGQGVDAERERDLSAKVNIRSGENLKSTAPDGIILGTGLARSVGVDVGGSVVLMATTASGGLNAVDARVIGLFQTSTKAFDDAALRVPLELAQKLLKVDGSHAWVVLLDETDETDNFVRTVHSTLDGSGLKLDVVPWYQLADFYNKTARLLKRQVDLVSIVIALLILLSISNTLTMSIMERTNEIGTLMALGQRRSRILRLFLAEGFFLGSFGAAGGVVFGIGLARLISLVGIPMPPPPGMSVGYTGRIMVTEDLILLAVFLAVGATVAAAAYPAYKASRLEIVNALRHNR